MCQAPRRFGKAFAAPAANAFTFSVSGVEARVLTRRRNGVEARVLTRRPKHWAGDSESIREQAARLSNKCGRGQSNHVVGARVLTRIPKDLRLETAASTSRSMIKGRPPRLSQIFQSYDAPLFFVTVCPLHRHRFPSLKAAKRRPRGVRHTSDKGIQCRTRSLCDHAGSFAFLCSRRSKFCPW